MAAAAQPGPFQTYLLAQTLQRGWRRTVPAALAPLLSDGPIILATVGFLQHIPTSFQRALSVAGGLFILYLAFGSATAWYTGAPRTDAASTADRQSVLRAALMNALSPGPYVYWSLVTGPILVTGWHETPLHGAAFLASFYVAIVTTLAVLIVAFGATQRLGPTYHRRLLGLSALALAGFGALQLWRGLSGDHAG